MARADIVTVTLTRLVFQDDPTPTTLSSVNGNVTHNNSATFLELHNTSGGSRDVMVLVPTDVDVDLAVTARTYTLAAGESGKTGTFPVEVYGSQLLVDVSGTGVTAVAFTVI